MHRCGRTLDHIDGAAGLCQRCGDLLTQAELTAALTKGTTNDPAPHK